MKQYDAGLLNAYGGGDIDWWWDYLRAELDRAHEFYEAQCPDTAVLQSQLSEAERKLALAREGAVDLAASMAAALSILQRAHSQKKQPSKVVASDSMFAQMMIDYQKSLDRARTTLAAIAETKP